MFRCEKLDDVEVGVFVDGVLVHSIGALESGEMLVIERLLQLICENGNRGGEHVDIVKATLAYLHAFDGQMLFGEIVVVLERVLHSH